MTKTEQKKWSPSLSGRWPMQVCSFILIGFVCGSAGVAASAPRDDSLEAGLRLISPPDGTQVEEPVARLEVDAAEMRDVSLVLSLQPFDASDWSALPRGTEWVIAPYHDAPLRLASLRLAVRIPTPVWWTAVGTDVATGVIRTSAVGRFTLLPAFTNRVAPSSRIEPSATGWLPSEQSAAGKPPTRRPIHLAAGYTLVPGAEPPKVSADLARASAAMHAELSRSGTGAYLALFGDTPAESARRLLDRAGAKIVATLSDGTFLVRMADRERVQLAADPGCLGVEPWEPAYKLSSTIDRSAPGRTALTALLFPDVDAEAVSAMLAALGATEVSVHRNGVNSLVRFELDRQRITDAAGLTDVTWIEPTPRDSILNDQAQWVVQTNTPDSRRVWDVGLRGQGQVLMTSDSGIRTNHEMFHDPSFDFTDFGDYPEHRKVIAYKRGSDNALVEFGDDAGSNYHGTHTAGTVAGNNDPTTNLPYDGMAKDAKLYFMDLAGTYSYGSIAPPADLNDLFLPSYVGNAAGAARISSNSWGASVQGFYTLASMQVDQFMWDHPDYLILFANGNIGINGSVSAPASAKNCVSVGGTGNGDARTSLYPASSRGPTSDLRRKPTIAAPGDLVASSVGTTRYAYSYYSGTSMATPAAAGAIALARQYLTEGWYPTGAPVAANAFTPSAALLKAMAVNSGENDVLSAHVPDNIVGWGRIAIDNVLFFPGDSRRILLIDETQGLVDRKFAEYRVQVTNPPQPFSVSLCWTDAPGSPILLSQIVNDLDLVVTNGTVTYLGNRMFNGVSIVGAGRDSINVEEGVRVPTPTAGLWTVRVEGHRVAVGPQPFALCISGGVGDGAGSIALDRYDYSLSDTLRVEVLDTNATAPLSVTVSSPTDTWGETVTLSGADGVFRGELVLAPSAPNPNDHRLAVSSGDLVTATYADASPGFNISATAKVSGLAPVITDVHARPLTSTTTLVTWTTDVPATSRVRFGEDTHLGMVQDSNGYSTQHAVRLTGLEPGRSYRYNVESAGRTGALSRDDFGGMNRNFTAKLPGRIALVLNGTNRRVLDTWMNTIDALHWDVDVFTGSDVDPPLVGNKSVGLRSYTCVLWQVGVDDYPPISDAQRAAIDSLLDSGGRLLVTGHDIGYGLADASVHSYTPEREAWLESGLKTRYYYDDLNYVSTFHGVPGNPTSGGYVSGISYYNVRSGSTSDLVGNAPNTDGVGTIDWYLDTSPPAPCGLHWESHTSRGSRWNAFWGGERSRLVVMYFEWAGLASSTAAPAAARTDVLAESVAWLLGRRPPTVTLTSPAPGEIITSDVVSIRYGIEPDSGHGIAGRSISYSLDDGSSWTLLHAATTPDSVYPWDLTGASGGASIGNSTRVRIRVTATDDASPALTGQDVMDASFTIARPNGDHTGPVVVPGSIRTTPTPVRAASPATLLATFSEAETGGGMVTAAEYSLGASPAAGGAGTAMSVAAPATTAAATVTLESNSLSPGVVTVWVRGRDTAGNWGPATSLYVMVNGEERTDAGDVPAVSYVAAASPNPFRESTSIHFGLAQVATIRLELFDVRGRRVRTLVHGQQAAGTHFANWDGRDEVGEPVSAGVFFARLTTPAGTYVKRLVRLE